MNRYQVRVVALDRFLGESNRRLVPSKPLPQLGAGRLTLLFLAIAAMVILGLLFAWSQLQYIHLNYQISKIYQEQKELQDLNRKLRIELSSLKSLPRLERLAAEELQMAPPAPHQIIVLR